MSVQLVDKSLKVTKEMSEIYDALAALVVSAKAGKEAGLSGASLALKVAGDGLQPLMSAVDGITGVELEAKEQLALFMQTQGVGAGQLGKAVVELMQAKAPVAPVASEAPSV